MNSKPSNWVKFFAAPALLLALLPACGQNNSSVSTSLPLTTSDTSTVLNACPDSVPAGSIEISGDLGERVSTQGVTFVKLPSSPTYVALESDALKVISQQQLQSEFPSAVIASNCAEAAGLLYLGDPADVTFDDYVLVRALSTLPPSLRTAEAIATAASELFSTRPEGPYNAADLDPVPTAINTDFATPGSTPAPDLSDAILVYAASFLPLDICTDENLVAVANAVAPSLNFTLDNVAANPCGLVLPGGVAVEPPVGPVAAGTLQISIQVSSFATDGFEVGPVEFEQFPTTLFPGFTSYAAEPGSSLLQISFDQLEIPGVDADICVIVHDPGTDPLIAANQIAVTGACETAPLVRGQVVDAVADVNAELLDVTPDGSQVVLVGSDDLTLLSIDGDSLTIVDDFDFDDLGITTPDGFGGADFTGVDISADGSFALVGVKEDDDLTNGLILAVALPSLDIIDSVEVGLGPDSVAIAPDGTYAAVGNEAEGDETNLPDPPPGSLSILDLSDIDNGNLTVVTEIDLAVDSGIIFPADPQPETVKISPDSSFIIASLQENNAVARINVLGTDGNGVPNDFSDPIAFDLGQRTGEGFIQGDLDDGDPECLSSDGYAGGILESFTSSREPDGIALSADGSFFVTADEDNVAVAESGAGIGGPFGSRSISVFDATTGALLGDSGNTIEQTVVDLRLPQRCDTKGPEPEVVTLGEVNGRTLAFATLERSDAVTIHDVTDPSNITLIDTVVLVTDPSDPNYVIANDTEAQLEPEGIEFISATNQLVTANSENDSVSLIQLVIN